MFFVQKAKVSARECSHVQTFHSSIRGQKKKEILHLYAAYSRDHISGERLLIYLAMALIVKILI